MRDRFTYSISICAWALSACCWLMPAPALAQFDNPFVLDEDKGLPSNWVRFIGKDQRGFVWLGTDRGMARFDGARVKVYQHQPGVAHTLPHDRVYTILENPVTKRIWVGTADGLAVLDPRSDRFLVRRAYLEHPDSLPDNIIRAVFLDRQGQFWVSAWTQGLVAYLPEGNKFKRFRFDLPPGELRHPGLNASRLNSIVAITQDARNDSLLWLATVAGLLRFNRYTHQYAFFYHAMPNADREYLTNSLIQIHGHDDGKIYLGSFGEASVFDPENGRFQPIEFQPQGQRWRYVLAICRKSASEIWLTYREGVTLYNTEEKRFTFYKKNDFREGRFHGVWMEDEQGRLWNGTSSNGVFLFDPLLQQSRNFDFPREREDLDYVPRRALESPNGRKIYLAVEEGDGLYIFDRHAQTWQVARPASPAGDNGFDAVDLAWDEQGRLLVLCSERLYRLSTDERRLLPVTLPLQGEIFRFRQILRDRRGHLWLSSRRNGVYRIAPNNQITHYREALNDEASSTQFIWVEHLFEDSRGWIWIRLARSFCVYLPERDVFLRYPFYPGQSSNTFRYLRNFVEDRSGRVWIAGEDEGVGWVDPARIEQGLTQRSSVAQGLASAKIAWLALDREERLWALSDRGLSRLDPRTHVWENFGAGYGIPAKGSYLTRLADGSMLIGYAKGGISLFHPDSLRHNEETPKPYIASFHVFDREIDDKRWLYDGHEVRLPYWDNYFSFEFSSIGFTLPQKNTYAYRLEGFNDEWIFAGDRRYAAYTNVPGGDYVFQVKAANNEGMWSEESFALRIRVATPWWGTWVFRLGLLSFLVFIAWGAYRYRVGQIRKKERVKSDFEKKLANVEMSALRAQMNPHFVFNCLNSIDYYILKNDSAKASDYLNRFSRLIRLILQNSSANYVNLKDELEALKLYMEMESLRFDNKFDYEVRVQKGLDLDNVEIPPMLLQPYVENAIWHGLMHKKGHGKVSITLSRDNGFLHCVVEDDGIGREQAAKLGSKKSVRKKSMGMRITSDRISLINKLYDTQTSVKVDDLKDEEGRPRGTRVALRILLS